MAKVILDNGILIMLGASIFFSVFDSFTKYLTFSFTSAEINFFRFAFGALVMFPFLFRQRFWINKSEFFYLTLRGLGGAVTFYLFVLALQSGTLSITMVLFFTNPLWALFIGAIFLEEGLSWNRIGGVTTAILGIAILIHPWGAEITRAHLYGLGAGIIGGANNVMTRYLRIRHSSLVIYAFQCFVGTLFSLPFFVGSVHIPELTDGLFLLMAAIFGLLGQVVMNHGFRYIRAAEGATILMTEVIFTTIAGIIIFHEPLTFTFVLGSVLILGSGIYLGLQTERRREGER